MAYTYRAPRPVSTILADIPCASAVTVDRVIAVGQHDPVATRLRDLGFVAGEEVRVVARAPFGGDPLVVQVGFTRFALRRSEAARIHIAHGARLGLE